MNDKVEFYLGKSHQPFLTLESSFQPEEGDYVNIQKETYLVTDRSFTVDHADSPQLRQMRCNVIVKKATG